MFELMKKLGFGRLAAAALGAALLIGTPAVSRFAMADKAASTAKVDLNSATDKELEELPGVGKATAKKIIEGRPYKSVDDLTKAGVSASEVAKLTPLVSVGAASAPAAATAAPAAASGAKIDLNSATEKDLEELPGVGTATAKKIVENRPYKSVDELSKAGMSAAKIAKIEPLVTAGTAAAPTPSAPAPASPAAATGAKVDLNSATDKELEELPGVGKATAKKIIAGRPYKSVDDLAKAGVTAAEVAKITPLVTVAASAAPTPATPTPAAPSTPTVSTPATPAATAGDKVDLNNASAKELEELPGVGAATAKKIIAGRPYSKVDDLLKAGVTEKEIAKIESKVTIGAASAAPASTPDVKAGSTATATPTGGSATPSKGDVWVNLESKIYHKEGSRFYGKTKKGTYMSEEAAIKAGYKEAKNNE